MSDNGLDEAYIRKHAKPGEDLEGAKLRLKGVVANRYQKLPDCLICAQSARDMSALQSIHEQGACSILEKSYPKTALEEKEFATQMAYRQQHISAQKIVAMGNIRGFLNHMGNQDYPINALLVASSAHGYINACLNLGVLEYGEIHDINAELHTKEEKARKQLVEQYEQRDPRAFPWRRK